tara:strand:- start:383 stop:580 length:198 start_codon:yes stop_codon:yes gene_type:complete
MKLGTTKRTQCRTVGDLRKFLVKTLNKVQIGVEKEDELFPIYVRREPLVGVDGQTEAVVFSDSDE